jgi:glycosyltransferase involved in cell wall biosynthesis
VVPCFNEALRLDRDGFLAFASQGPVELIFVDDGSTDGTGHLLDELCTHLRATGVHAQALSLPKNRGKGEAVRQGMLEALRRGALVVGYLDADLATPPGEMSRLVRTMLETPADVALAARVALLGRKIIRKASRHYLGRVFATFASFVLRMPVYDTQCGAKAFRRTPALEAALAIPFSARWAFDVELIGRLRAGTRNVRGLPMDAFIEMPLRSWRDVANSTLTFAAFPLLGIELLRIAFALRKWRSA